MLDDPVGSIADPGQNNQVLFGALLELVLIIANIGTAVVISRSSGDGARSSRWSM